jgi:ribosomal protein S18 acetylase RimI-like enzyme
MHPLDNIIWNALSTRQAHLAESAGAARRFIPEISPLAGLREPSAESYRSLGGLVPEKSVAAVFLDEPYAPRPGWQWIGGAPLLQMVCENGKQLDPAQSSHEIRIIELGDKDSSEMIELTGLTKPGPFGKRTHELGTYFGIHHQGKLIAMAGERMKVPGFTEVSAVCTHPEHTGKGYARLLMRKVMGQIRERGETPFLHVREDNVGAIALYEKLRFTKRLRAHYAILRRSKE